MTPKSYTVYVDDKNKTQACLTFAIYENSKDLDRELERQGCKVIGHLSSGSEREAKDYADQVLR
jgi:hypothetical protein